MFKNDCLDALYLQQGNSYGHSLSYEKHSLLLAET